MLRTSHRLSLLSCQLNSSVLSTRIITRNRVSPAVTARKMSHLFEDATPAEVKNAKVYFPILSYDGVSIVASAKGENEVV